MTDEMFRMAVDIQEDDDYDDDWDEGSGDGLSESAVTSEALHGRKERNVTAEPEDPRTIIARVISREMEVSPREVPDTIIDALAAAGWRLGRIRSQ